MSSYGCDVGYALLYLNVIGLGSGVWVSSLLKRIGSPLMWGGVHAASTPGNKMIVVVVVVVVVVFWDMLRAVSMHFQYRSDQN